MGSREGFVVFYFKSRLLFLLVGEKTVFLLPIPAEPAATFLCFLLISIM